MKIQKRAIRLINLSKYNAHTEPLFKQFKLLKVNHILQMQEFKCYHKFNKNNTLPAYLQHLKLLPNSSIHSHNTRGKTDLHIHRTTHTFAKQCLRQHIPVLLNNAPSSITDKFLTHSIQGFSNYVNNHFVNKYQQYCTIPNCYYSDSVWHCFVFDPLRVVRAKLFRIVHSSVTRSFIRGAWRGSCDTICPALSFHFDFTDVSDLCYGLPTFGHFTIYLCHASLAQKRCKLFYVYLMLL